MRKTLVLALFLVAAFSFGYAKDKKEYLFGRLVDVRTQKLPPSAGPKAPDSKDPLSTVTITMAKRQASIRYSLIISADAEMLYLSCDRESSAAQPELKNDMDLKWRNAGEDTVEIVDAKGKKFNLEVLRRVAKDAPSLKPKPENIAPAK